jgi:hypothetical protein
LRGVTLLGALGDSYTGFDHGVGHPLLFLCDAKVPNYRKNKGFNVLGPYAEWPKVADAVIKATAKPWYLGVRAKAESGKNTTLPSPPRSAKSRKTKR